MCSSTFLTLHNNSLAKSRWGKVSQTKLKRKTPPNDTCICSQSCDWSKGKSLLSNWHLKLYTFQVNYLNSSFKWNRAKARVCESRTAKLLMLQWLKVSCRAWYRDIDSACHSIVCVSVGRACVTLEKQFEIFCNVMWCYLVYSFQPSNFYWFCISHSCLNSQPLPPDLTRYKTCCIIKTT